MEREANLLVPSAIPKNFNCSVNPDTSSSFSSSQPEFLRHFQAAFKRHRPLAQFSVSSAVMSERTLGLTTITKSNKRTMLPTSIRPRRLLEPQNEICKSSASHCGIEVAVKKPQPNISINHGHPVKNLTVQTKSTMPIVSETQEDESITPPSNVGIFTEGFDERLDPYVAQRDESERASSCLDKTSISSLHVGSQQAKGHKMLHFSSGHNNTSQEMEWITSSNQGEASVIINEEESNKQKFQDAESDVNLRFNGGASSMSQRLPIAKDALRTFQNFLNQPLTQSSAGGTSSVTTTSVHSTSAPTQNSTTFCPHSCRDVSTLATLESFGSLKVNSHIAKSSHKEICGVVTNKTSPAAQVHDSAVSAKTEVMQCINGNERKITLPQESSISKCSSLLDNKLTEMEELVDGGGSMQSQSNLCKTVASGVKFDSSRSGKQEKVDSTKTAPRKRNYDPNMFFKVNGKLYQRLGKIGSGGSSEVHKVISSDCTIYALKKIRLKGRDYATAYGFCQEIVYLNKLKGKNNIIHLIDYEVTDRTLLEEVMNGSTSNKDAKVKDDGYIYMVLEYGEIDLAHMLSQKWKEIDRSSSNHTIEENWLRFYWQQILQAVNTIHEERIVHSDLKPANFLLVKGSLKLIDFGIAKAIMNDTTNIQRDAQVGTLSYMSPEAFMCNERDANGNTIKCGRPSDIWSLGCILYQMVYGKTPFAEYKTFWAKFKVITDPTHEIKYEALHNPWLLDLMKKCLAWDRHERWRIPQLLQHPFLVPPVLPQIPLSHDHISTLFRYIAETCKNKEEALSLCSQLQKLR